MAARLRQHDSYQYDAFGNLSPRRRTARRLSILLIRPGLGNVVGEYTGSGSLIADFTYGLGLTQPGDASGRLLLRFRRARLDGRLVGGCGEAIRTSTATCRSASVLTSTVRLSPIRFSSSASPES